MSKVLYIILISLFSLTIISCSDEEEEYTATSTTTTSVLYVAVGSGGTILTSSDNGTTWTSMTSGTSKTLSRESRVTESAQEIVDSTPYIC